MRRVAPGVIASGAGRPAGERDVIQLKIWEWAALAALIVAGSVGAVLAGLAIGCAIGGTL